MKTKTWALSILIGLAFSFSAKVAKAEDVTIVKNVDSVVLEDSSAHNRMGQDYILTYDSGVIVSPAVGAGLTFGKYLDRNSLLQVNAGGGAFPLFFFTMNARVISASYKQFLGNSFYYRAGLGLREITVDSWEIFDVVAGQVAKSRSVVADLAIGNQWQWKNFTLGCDWIGLMPALATLESTIETSGISNTSDRQQIENDWDQVSQATSLQLLRFIIGASF